METTTPITIKKTNNPGVHAVDFKSLGFSKYIADHMLVADYRDGEWQEASIVPYGAINLYPTSLCLHYGQTVFEGMKAFRMQDDRINLFRIHRHLERFNKSLDRMCMPAVPPGIFVEGLHQLIELDKNWVPNPADGALYIRPVMFATEAKLGVKISDEYKLIIFSTPVQAAFTKPLKVKVETDYIRAGRGGTGSAKCGGNYGGAFYPTKLAKEQGYDQVLWTGGKDNQFIEESGMMNAMFVINDKLITPPLSDSILDGITRNSLLAIANDLDIEVEERPVSIHELEQAFAGKIITEAFGAGTAAVIAPIETIGIHGRNYHLPVSAESGVANKLKDRLEQIRTGRVTDTHNWNYII